MQKPPTDQREIGLADFVVLAASCVTWIDDS